MRERSVCACVCVDGPMDSFVVREMRVRVDDGQPTVVELFAGAGGMAIGLERSGLKHVALVEWDSPSPPDVKVKLSLLTTSWM